jgi:hypothetical protein
MAQKRKKVHFGSQHITIEDSSLVDRVYYDPETNTLDAVFKGKNKKEETRYRYRGVGPKVFAKFVLAKSMGKFFNSKIRKKYQYQPVL